MSTTLRQTIVLLTLPVLLAARAPWPTAPLETLPTPTLVQHVSSSVNPVGIGIPGNSFRFTLPNRVGAGNCLILGISYAYSATRTVNITDNNGNTWPSSPAATGNPGSSLISSIFVLPNANPGLTTITVTFDDALLPFQYTVSEFYNVDRISPVNGFSAGTSTAPDLSSGSFTPGDNDANGGNLIWSYFADRVGGTPNWTTTFVAGSSFQLLDADIAWHHQGLPHASESFVQATAAPINPSMTAVMTPGNDTYNGVSVALRAAMTGTPPDPGIRIIRIAHLTNETPPAAWDLQFPSSGNLVVATMQEQTIFDVASVTDNRGNSYTKIAKDPTMPQFWYVGGASTSPDLKMTLNSRSFNGGVTAVLYDITGADPSPVDTVVGLPLFEFLGAHLINSPVIVPASANGLTIVVMSLGTGPTSALDIGSPAGSVLDVVYYAGENDNDTMDNADGKAHFYNADTLPETWNWVIDNDNLPTSVVATGVHFKRATADGSPANPGPLLRQRDSGRAARLGARR